jgi:hypothetical protein
LLYYRCKEEIDKMQKLAKIENGSAVALTLVDENGALTTYKLALAVDKAYSFCGETLKYVFIAENGFGFEGAYSGGATGCGVESYDIKHLATENRYKILATDLAEINVKVDAHNAACDAERARELEIKAKKDAAVAAALDFEKATTVYDGPAGQLIGKMYRGRYGLDFGYTMLIGKASHEFYINRSKLINKAGNISSQAVKTYGAEGRVMAKAALAWEATSNEQFKLAKASV